MQMKPSLREKLKFIIPGIIFYFVLDFFFQSMSFSPGAVVLLLLFSGASAFWITNRKLLAILPAMLFATGSATFLLSIGQSSLQKYFMLFVSLLFMVIMLGLYRFFTPEAKRPQAEIIKLLDSGFNLNQAIVMFSIFFLSCGIYGIYIITDVRPWVMMLIMFIGIYLSSYYLIQINFLKSQELELHLDYYKNRTFSFYAFLLPVLMIELVWALTYLPINHLTFGAIILIIFYSYWNILRNHLRNELTRGKFISSIVFGALTITLILLTSRLYIN